MVSGAFTDSVFASNGINRSAARVAISDCYHQFFRQSCIAVAFTARSLVRFGCLAVSFASGLPSFCYHITRVIAVGPKKKVQWIAAPVDVARMAHAEAIWYGTSHDEVGKSVGSYVFPAEFELPIVIWKCARLPEPTIIETANRHLIPKKTDVFIGWIDFTREIRHALFRFIHNTDMGEFSGCRVFSGCGARAIISNWQEIRRKLESTLTLPP